MTAIDEENVMEDGSVLIDKVLLDSFRNEGYKYFTMINYESFDKLLESHQHELCGYDLVKYKDITYNDTVVFLEDLKKPYNLLYKNPKFAFQNEFRIIANKSGGYYKIVMKDDKVELCPMFSDTPIQSLPVYNMNIGDITGFSQIVNIENFNSYNDNFYYCRIAPEVYNG